MKSLIRSSVVCPDYRIKYPRITYGKGVYLFDEEGKKYLDASSGSAAVSNIGHGIEEVGEILKDQISKISVLPTHYFSSKIVEDYLDTLVEFAPNGFEKAWTVMSGTEAVENALKLAIQYHKLIGDGARYKIISRNLSYHGNSIFTLDVGGMPSRKELYSFWMQNFPHVSPANLYRKSHHLTDEEYVHELALEFENTLIKENPLSFAAFIFEPVVGAAIGAVSPPKGYLEKIFQICKKYGIICIADEVMTGFGRTGKNFGIESTELVPDIIATGKGISAGYYPLAAIIASKKIMAPFIEKNTHFLAGNTYACNPVGCAVGKFVIEYLEKNELVKKSKFQGEYLKKRLEQLKKFEIVGDVRGEGLLIGIEFIKDKITKEPFPPELNLSTQISRLALNEGVVLYPGRGSRDGQSGDHILITPPFIINDQQCDEILYSLESSIEQVMENYV
jgi:adenosylmethionine-8-amino-7-oxononanoate aminotransferase